ncbi:MAG: uracil phosphoribosyltransferase [Planctomycetales bacterium]|nr:uracil phosphoribosyltransferase [Planctomycetales bacterium]
MPVHVADHPVVEHHLAHLREKSTSPEQFRQATARLTWLLAFHATAQLATQRVAVETPLTTTTGQRLSQRIGLVPIIRAGIAMVDPMLDMLPHAEVWYLGLYRNEKTAEPVEYYNKLADFDPVDIAFVLDPMLATGGSACLAISALRDKGVSRTKLLSIIASQTGIERVQNESPQTDIYVCTIDAELNSQKFIVPGLGDAGDRAFNA